MSLSTPKECAPCADAIDMYGGPGAENHAAAAGQVLTTLFDDFQPGMCPESYLRAMDTGSRAAVAPRIAAGLVNNTIAMAQGGAL